MLASKSLSDEKKQEILEHFKKRLQKEAVRKMNFICLFMCLLSISIEKIPRQLAYAIFDCCRSIILRTSDQVLEFTQSCIGKVNTKFVEHPLPYKNVYPSFDTHLYIC